MKNKLALIVAAALVGGVTAAYADNTATEQQGDVAATVKTTGKVKVAKKPVKKDLQAQVQNLQQQVNNLQKAVDADTKKDNRNAIGNLAEMYAHGPALVTSPALGTRRSAEDASDLMVSLPSMNEDLQLLQIRQRMDHYALSTGLDLPQRPIIAVSGAVEGQASDVQSYASNTHKFDADLTRGELDFIGEASPWATGALILSYDNAVFQGITSRVGNSRVQLSRGYVTIGHLDSSPFYGSIGQFYMPFGTYNSYRVTTAWTQILGRIDQRGIVLGYNQYGIYAQVYGFRGDTEVNSSPDPLKRGGANIGYAHDITDNLNIDAGAGWTGNIAESQGMQQTYSPAGFFQGFGNYVNTETFETLQHRVPGVDAHAKISYNPFVILGEYVGATRAFDPTDLSFDGYGASPKALDVQAAYQFKTFSKPSTFAIGGSRTWEALALNMPKYDMFAMYNVALVKDTIESIEYRRDTNYPTSDMAGGNGAAPQLSQGSHRNIVTAQIGVYF